LPSNGSTCYISIKEESAVKKIEENAKHNENERRNQDKVVEGWPGPYFSIKKKNARNVKF
jgi:hypothetical protein